MEKDNSTIGTFVENIRYNSKFLEFAPIIFVSALSGQRVTNIFELIDRVYAQYTRRVETGELNRKIREIIEANPPPGRQSRPHIFNYITQVAIKPPTFALFVRNPADIHFSYERYLVNRIRETFGFRRGPDPPLLPEKEVLTPQTAPCATVRRCSHRRKPFLLRF